MNFRTLTCIVAGIGISLVAVPSQAATLFNNWYYAIDNFTDGSPTSGGGYEQYGMAFRTDANKAYFAFNTNMPLGGLTVSGARNGTVAIGDLFLNFGSGTLKNASDFTSSNVLGIRFDSNNDSFDNGNGTVNNSVGVYKDITVTSLMNVNTGYNTLQDYYNAGWDKGAGAMGDLSTSTAVKNYLGNGAMFTNMKTGTKIGDITSLNSSQLSTLGLNFGNFSATGTSTYGFSFDKSLLKSGVFRGHVFEECINDGTAIDVPEPGVVALITAGAVSGLFLVRRRRRKQA